MAYEDVASNYESLQDHEKRIKDLEKIVETLANRIYHLEQGRVE